MIHIYFKMYCKKNYRILTVIFFLCRSTLMYNTDLVLIIIWLYFNCFKGNTRFVAAVNGMSMFSRVLHTFITWLQPYDTCSEM